MDRTLLRRVGLAASMMIVLPIAGGRSASAAPSVVESSSPLVFFRTFNRDTSQLLRRVFRLNPRTGKNLSPVALPPDFRSFVDAVQVGNISFVVWTSKRDRLSLGAAGPDGRIVRRWPVGSAGGFEVRPVPDDPTSGTGSGFLRVSADRRTALLVNGRGRRFGRYVDLRSGAVHNTPLPDGISGQIAGAAAIGSRFVLVGNTGSLVTVGRRGNVLARGSVNLPATGPDRIDLVDIVALSANSAVASFVTSRTAKVARRRFVARYNPRSGATRVARNFADPGGEAFAATATHFEVLGADPYRWIAVGSMGAHCGPLRPRPPDLPPPVSALSRTRLRFPFSTTPPAPAREASSCASSTSRTSTTCQATLCMRSSKWKSPQPESSDAPASENHHPEGSTCRILSTFGSLSRRA